MHHFQLPHRCFDPYGFRSEITLGALGALFPKLPKFWGLKFGILIFTSRHQFLLHNIDLLGPDSQEHENFSGKKFFWVSAIFDPKSADGSQIAFAQWNHVRSLFKSKNGS